jgi:AcrR family transcriptional regulator
MATTPDRRVRRTRKALQEALLALMSEKRYEAVTVNDIIERADVGRSTFYTHYTDKDDLLQDGMADLRSMLEQPTGTRPTSPRRALNFSLPMFRHVHAQRRLARAVFGQPRRTPLLQQIEVLLADVVRTELATLQPPTGTSPVPHEALVRYVVGACLSLLEWWLTTGTAISPEDIDRILQTLVTPGIQAATTTDHHQQHNRRQSRIEM